MTNENPPIDHDVLDAIRSLQIPQSEDLVEQIIQTYIEDSAALVSLLEHAVTHSDSEGIRASAHSLKSCSGNVGARQVVELSRHLEMLGREGNLRTVGSVLSELQGELSRAIAELKSMVCPA